MNLKNVMLSNYKDGFCVEERRQRGRFGPEVSEDEYKYTQSKNILNEKKLFNIVSSVYKEDDFFS